MSETSKRMPLEEIEKTQEYQRLTQKQRLFVSTYVAGGLLDGAYDPVASVRTAYQTKSPEVARIMSYSLMQNIRVVAVLNRHFGAEPIEELLVMLDRAINNKKLTIAQIQALRLKCEIMGFTTGIPGHTPLSAGLQEAQESAKVDRKSKRKTAERPLKPEKPSDYNFYK